MRFDQKMMDYVMGDITLTRLNNCRKTIAEKQLKSKQKVLAVDLLYTK